MADHVALLRGINVRRAKRIAMADLRAVVEGLGFHDVTTVLASGNVVFAGRAVPDPATLREAVRDGTGVDAPLVIVAGERFREIAAANPLRRDDRDATRLLVSFPAAPLDVDALLLAAPTTRDLVPEEFVATPGAIYQWLPDGVLASRVPAAFWRSVGVTVTARNDATVRRVVAVLDARQTLDAR
ncbi:hypothetical protein AS850_05440 [Frondihabitans sp. 762G35]|uniref:DUF1697 domain-containing protein n=1 Tax=Frondihabitans sp. 762G35 TaxID=1446794 RepID=UPI000D2094D5|nr:DUF1697 domain-containing protein [Frondihabitans sp. 762G35]ARC56516.1 hypothetical protein AS850_05440 [Frondihabitans sp. 762G35]